MQNEFLVSAPYDRSKKKNELEQKPYGFNTLISKDLAVNVKASIPLIKRLAPVYDEFDGPEFKNPIQESPARPSPDLGLDPSPSVKQPRRKRRTQDEITSDLEKAASALEKAKEVFDDSQAAQIADIMSGRDQEKENEEKEGGL